MSSNVSTLRDQVISSSFWLVIRENFNFIVRTIGIFLLVKLLSTEQYGLYSVVSSITIFIGSFSMLGVHVYIAKYAKSDIEDACAAATTLLLLSSLIIIAVAFLLIPLFIKLTHTPQIYPVILPLILFQVLGNIRLIPMALLERSLNYKVLSSIDITAQILYYIVAIPLAALKIGVWAPTVGTIVMTLYMSVRTISVIHYKFKVSRDLHKIKEIFIFGFNYTLSMIGWQAKSLILPFIITPLTNVSVAGCISIANRIADSLDLFRFSNGKISLTVLSKIQNDIKGFKDKIVKGISYQLIALGLLSTIFLLFSPVVIKVVLGKEWFPVISILPFVFYNAFCNAPGAVLSSVLYIKNKAQYVTLCYLLQHISIGALSWLMISYYGIKGYGYAIVASTPAYIMLFFFINRTIGKISYLSILVWFITFSGLIFFNSIGFLSSIFLVLPIIIKETREQFMFLIKIGLNILKTKREKLCFFRKSTDIG